MVHLKLCKNLHKSTESPEVQEYAENFGRPPRADKETELPVSIKEHAPNSALFLNRLKVQGCLVLKNLVKIKTLKVQ